MKSKDQLLLEEAYTKVATQNEIIDEGVWSQIKGLGKGLASGALTGLQNVAAGAAKAVGVKVDDTNRQTMGQSYAKAQQGSMLKGFQTSAEKTVNDFINDAKKMGVDLNDPNMAKLFPEAAAAFTDVQNLLKYVKNPSAAPVAAAPSTPTSSTTTSPTTTPPPKAKHTGGKVAGQLSTTPSAVRRRKPTAAKPPAPPSTPAPSTPAPAAPTASKPLGFNNSRY